MLFRIYKYLVVALLLFSISCTGERQQTFSFVQLCDPQLGMGGYEHDINSFRQAVRTINELNTDFVIICGDLVHHRTDSSFSDFLAIREEFQIPCYVIPGNHDVGSNPNDETLGFYRTKIGKDYYQFRFKGYSFIATNTQLWKVFVEHESEKHDVWFKEALTKKILKKRPVFVIGHHPLYIGVPDEEEQYSNLPPGKRQELLELFTQNNVVAYLSGHRHKTLINNYENIQMVSGETTSKNFDKRPLGFRHWEVTADTIKHHFISIE